MLYKLFSCKIDISKRITDGKVYLMGFLLHYKIILILAFCNHIMMIVEHMEKSSVAIMIAIFSNICSFRTKLMDYLSL